MRSFFAALLSLVATAYAVSHLDHNTENTPMLIASMLVITSWWMQSEVWQKPMSGMLVLHPDKRRRIAYGGYLISFVLSIIFSGATMIGAMIIYGFNEAFPPLCIAGGCSFIPGIVAAFGMYRTRDG